MNPVERYTYRVSWSEEDQEYVASCAEFPSLSWLSEDQTKVLRGIQKVVGEVVEDMIRRKEKVPTPISTRKFSGELRVRIPPNLHRKLATEAEELATSLNRLIVNKLSG